MARTGSAAQIAAVGRPDVRLSWKIADALQANLHFV